MAKQQIILKCKKVKFYSPLDEDLFFEGIKKISNIGDVKGFGDEIHLYVIRRQIKNDDFRNLIALFRRYKIGLEQLAVFLTPRNEQIYHGYKKIFHINVYPAREG